MVPCHRVLGKSGGITGYHWGLTRKRAMLGWEAAQVTAGQVIAIVVTAATFSIRCPMRVGNRPLRRRRAFLALCASMKSASLA